MHAASQQPLQKIAVRPSPLASFDAQVVPLKIPGTPSERQQQKDDDNAIKRDSNPRRKLLAAERADEKYAPKHDVERN
jgi:hypothetical protein